MLPVRTVAEWLQEKQIGVELLAEKAGLDRKVADAIAHGRYTPSPQQRQRIAAALGVEISQVLWRNTQEVEHMYGHGPQFGRTP